LPNSQEYIGFVEFTGKGVQEGLLDARKQAKALIGFDSSLRFFVGMQIPELQKADYDIPVRVEKGSWQVLIPENIEAWIKLWASTAVLAYLTSAAAKTAQNDFADVGLKDIFRRSLEGIQWFIKIGKHLGELGKRKFEKVRWRNNNTEVGIPNGEGQYLFVPKGFLEWFVQAPKSLITDLAEVISTSRQLNVSLIYPDHVETVSVTQNDRHVFFFKEESEEMLFPDLKHGQHIALEGLVTRGNENSNSIGFLYCEHILTCYPSKGSIVRFKSALFLECKITGTITRCDKFGNMSDPRPKIIFDDLVPLEVEPDMKDLFEESGLDNMDSEE
jgi:hypothetical protein